MVEFETLDKQLARWEIFIFSFNWFHLLEWCVINKSQLVSLRGYSFFVKMKVQVFIFLPILLLLLIASFVGNLFVLIVVLRSKPIRRKPSVMYILNGAAANLLFVAIVGLSLMFIVLNPDPFQSRPIWYCKMYDTYFYVNAFIITNTVNIIALDKYFAIIKPFFYRQYSTTRNAFIITISSWLVANIFSIPKFLSVFSGNGPRWCRKSNDPVRETIEVISEVFHLVLVFLVPIIITFSVYGRLVHRLWISNHESQGTDLALLKSRRNLTKLSITVTILFLICWVPHTIETIWWCLGLKRPTILELLKLYASLFVFAYSAISPVIYTFFNEATLQAARRMACCVCCKRSLRMNSRNVQITPDNSESTALRLAVRPAKTDQHLRQAFGTGREN